jgi:hypothetical protein
MTNDDTSSGRDLAQPAAESWAAAMNTPDEDTSKSYSWGRNLPALRLNRPRETESSQRSAPAPTVYRLKPPWYLRIVRVLLGLVLLAVAWGLAMLLMAWGQSIWANLPQMWRAEWSELFFALNVLGLLVLAGATLAILVVGLFSLLVGLTARGW